MYGCCGSHHHVHLLIPIKIEQIINWFQYVPVSLMFLAKHAHVSWLYPHSGWIIIIHWPEICRNIGKIMWVNYHISLTWIVGPFGDDFPYEPWFQWGRPVRSWSNLPRIMVDSPNPILIIPVTKNDERSLDPHQWKIRGWYISFFSQHSTRKINKYLKNSYSNEIPINNTVKLIL